jgi:hypothetical protein
MYHKQGVKYTLNKEIKKKVKLKYHLPSQLHISFFFYILENFMAWERF